MSLPSITSDVESHDENLAYVKVRKVIHYSGENYLKGIPTCNEIVAENNAERLTDILEDALAEHWEIPFIAVDIEGASEKIGGKSHYVLHLYGFLFNTQKIVVTLLGIRVFFNIVVLEKKSADIFEEKIVEILSGEKVN
jgi:hypothetical protein